MKDLLITGGLGQAGMAIAEAAARRGWTVTLVGRSQAASKSEKIRDWLQNRAFRFVCLDIFDPSAHPLLLELAAHSDCWIQAAEPYQKADLKRSEFQQNAENLLDLALQAGFHRDGAKKFARIGSPLVEVVNEATFLKRKGIGFVEDFPLDAHFHQQAPFRTAYFRAKDIYATTARRYFLEKKLSVMHLCPTALVGAFGDKAADYDGFVHVLNGDFPYNIYLPTNFVNAVPVGHFAEAALDALLKGQAGECYQFAGPNLPVAELMEMALVASKKPVPRLRWPAPPGFVSLPMVAAMALPLRLFNRPRPWWLEPDLHAMLAMMGKRNSEKAAAKLGYKTPTLVELQAAVNEAVGWMGY